MTYARDHNADISEKSRFKIKLLELLTLQYACTGKHAPNSVNADYFCRVMVALPLNSVSHLLE